jgi:hypothetical protein
MARKKKAEKAGNEIEDTQLQKAAKEYKKDKDKERKQIKATMDLISKRANQLMDIPVEIDEDDGTITEAIFKARRLNKKEMSQFRSFALSADEVLDLPEEDKEELASEGYTLLSMVIVEPELTPEEWEEVDLALTQDLVYKVGILQNEPNDGRVIRAFKDLSIRLMTQNSTI